jgi:hypothetical protein
MKQQQKVILQEPFRNQIIQPNIANMTYKELSESKNPVAQKLFNDIKPYINQIGQIDDKILISDLINQITQHIEHDQKKDQTQHQEQRSQQTSPVKNNDEPFTNIEDAVMPINKTTTTKSAKLQLQKVQNCKQRKVMSL